MKKMKRTYQSHRHRPLARPLITILLILVVVAGGLAVPVSAAQDQAMPASQQAVTSGKYMQPQFSPPSGSSAVSMVQPANPTFGKLQQPAVQIGQMSVSNAYPPNNNQYQAEAGEYVTITAAFTVPDGISIYNPVLYLFLEDGLEFVGMISPTDVPTQTLPGPGQDPYRPNDRSTQLEWRDIPSIENSTGSPISVAYSIRALARQRYWLHLIGQDVPHNTVLRPVPLLRWSDDPAEEPDPTSNLRVRDDQCGTNNRECVTFIRPDLRYQDPNNGSYFASTGVFQGNGEVVFTLHLRNRQQRPNAYEVRLTDTLSANLTYLSASPPPDSTGVGPGGETLLFWTLSSPIETYPDEEVFAITARLPATMVAGTGVTSTANASYSTFSGTVAYEGQYYDAPPATNPAYTARSVLRSGYTIEKVADTPRINDNVYIGDEVTYTINLVLNPGMLMYLPVFEDILPRGFHYVAGSMQVSGASLVGSVEVTRTGQSQEKLTWHLDSLVAGGSQKTVQMTYRVLQTGLNFDGQNVYANGRGEFAGRLEVRNELRPCWHTSSQPTSPLYCMPTPYPRDSVWITQPWLADTFVKTRPEGGTEFEVGKTVRYRVTLRNSGYATAYDIVVTDTLPQGIAIGDSWLSDVTPPSPAVNLVSRPAAGATGVVTWTLDQLAAGQQVWLWYDTLILPSAPPGDQLTNLVHIAAYSSQPGAAAVERHYKDFDGTPTQPDPIPPPASAPYVVVLGLNVAKEDTPDAAVPGRLLTYTLSLGNTSHEHAASNVRITDTYDAKLTYVGYLVSDPLAITLLRHDVAQRLIVWGISNVPANGSISDYFIQPTFQVNRPLPQTAISVLNQAQIDGQGDLVGQVTRWIETPLNLPYLSIEKSGPTTASPGETVEYGLHVTNLGSLTATQVVLDEVYDPNVSYVGATPPPSQGNYRWVFGSLPAGDSQHVTVTLQVHRPVPAGVSTVVNNTAVSSAEVYQTAGPPFTTNLLVPILHLEKIDFPDPVVEGQPLQYTIHYSVTGSVGATNVVITDTLDPFASTIVSTSPPGACAGRVCRWENPNPVPSQQYTIIVQVATAASIPETVCRLMNRVTISSAEVGPSTITQFTALFGRVCNFVYLPLLTKGATGVQSR